MEIHFCSICRFYKLLYSIIEIRQGFFAIFGKLSAGGRYDDYFSGKGYEKPRNAFCFIDEKYAFSIPEEDYFRLCLYDKKELSSDEIEEIKKGVSQRTAKYKAVKYLSYRYMTEAELSQKLRKDGYDEDVILNVVTELKSMGYINDLIYAQKYVYDR